MGLDTHFGDLNSVTWHGSSGKWGSQVGGFDTEVWVIQFEKLGFSSGGQVQGFKH